MKELSEEEILMVSTLKSPINIDNAKGLPVFEKNTEFEDAFSRLSALGRKNPTHALEVICRICESTENEWVLDLIASGPLEEILRSDSEEVQSTVKQLRLESLAFRELTN